MLSVNKVILLGNLGKDAETRNLTSAGHTVTNFSVATTYSYKKNEEWINETTWHNIVVFNASDYVLSALVKGQPVYIEGRTQKRKYDNSEGVTIYVTEVVADKIIPLDKVERVEADRDDNDGWGKHKPTNAIHEESLEKDPDDDLPF